MMKWWIECGNGGGRHKEVAGVMTRRDVSLSNTGEVKKKTKKPTNGLLWVPSVRQLLFACTAVLLGDSFHGGITNPQRQGQSHSAAPTPAQSNRPVCLHVPVKRRINRHRSTSDGQASAGGHLG